MLATVQFFSLWFPRNRSGEMEPWWKVVKCPQSAALRQRHKTSPAGLQHCTMHKFVKAEKQTISPFTDKWIWAQLHVPFYFCVCLFCINVNVQFQFVLMWNLLPWCTNFSQPAGLKEKRPVILFALFPEDKQLSLDLFTLVWKKNPWRNCKYLLPCL